MTERTMEQSATREFRLNLKALPRSFKDAWFRLGKEPESEREESQATFHNLFLHIARGNPVIAELHRERAAALRHGL